METNLEKFERDPKKNNGWNYDYAFIAEISELTKDGDYYMGMEETESVLIALKNYFNLNPTTPKQQINTNKTVL